ncbi:SAM-dependent methyltransferase [Aquibacillus halophilus]|uniref:tRNA 5-hydroxyuridine methyltransferase n=2 Tax=Aquibacillus halophilus TaxID=930132 RepID=A0A6A8DBE7_9BACI|nr:SAM-dependent methyltransferase [Aquibacillus halophilus]
MHTIDKKADWVSRLEEYAAENRVPIMEPLGMDFLMQIVRLKKPKKILEIGSAIGYSALRMLEASPETQIVTIERDEIRYQEAVSNINKLAPENKITVIFGDALEETNEIKKLAPYDLLFIDAAKGQYQRFFETYSEYLTEDAIIISDNVLFKGLVANSSSDKDRLTNLAIKIRTYNEWLIKHPSYKTSIVPIGDGVAISVRR